MSSKLTKINIIKPIGDSSLKIEVSLNLADYLSNIRKELENENVINGALSFSKKDSKKVNDNLAEIYCEDEKNILLELIIEVINNEYYLYLINNSSCNILNKKFKLDHGCTMSFDGIKRACSPAFKMKGCELNLIENDRKGQFEFGSKEDWMMKTNLFFNSTNIDVRNFAKLGLSESFQKNFINSSYQYTELSKASFKLCKESLEPTPEFINAVEEAIQSLDSARKFREITEEFGQFIPTEVILGGRVYFKIDKSSKKGLLNITRNSSNSKSQSNLYNFEAMKLLGGKLHDDDNEFNETAWRESLKNYQNWECIEFKNPISIFRLLPDDLCKRAFTSIGKRILYSSIEDYDYNVHDTQTPNVCELSNLPSHISDLIQNKNADCDIFATVVNTEDSRNTFFNCQILRPSSGKPSIIIHCAQKNFQKRKYRLKISLMVTGYDTEFNFIQSDVSVELRKNVYDSQIHFFYSMTLEVEHDLITRNIPFFGIPVFNNLDPLNNSLVIGHSFRKDDNKLKIDTFSYCLKNNRYVNLPKFTFYTFIILNNNAYKSFPFKFNMSGKPFVEFDGFTGSNTSKFKSFFKKYNPKYVSLYLRLKDNYEPIFLNQMSKRIDVEYVECNCDNTCFICKNKTLRLSKNDHIECIFYDPNIRNISD